MGRHRVVAMTRPKRDRRRPETVWLDDDQQRAWRQLLSMIMELPAALESDLQRTTGLTTFEYVVLANLSEADDWTLRMSELASTANSSLSRLSHVVKRLADDGLVIKRVCADDGRVSSAGRPRPLLTGSPSPVDCISLIVCAWWMVRGQTAVVPPRIELTSIAGHADFPKKHRTLPLTNVTILC
jgi:hypothetical protein